MESGNKVLTNCCIYSGHAHMYLAVHQNLVSINLQSVCLCGEEDARVPSSPL